MGFIEALASGTDSPKSQVIRDIDAQLERAKQAPENLIALEALHEDLLAFFADRLKVHLRDEGIRHDVIDAVFALGDDDLVRVTAKSRALQAFLNTEDGAALLAGYRRAANILKAEEGKGFDVAAALTELDPSSAPPLRPLP